MCQPKSHDSADGGKCTVQLSTTNQIQFQTHTGLHVTASTQYLDRIKQILQHSLVA